MNGWALLAVTRPAITAFVALLAIGPAAWAGQEGPFDDLQDGEDELAERESERKPRARDEEPERANAADEESESPEMDGDEEPEWEAESDSEPESDSVAERRPTPTKEQQADAERTIKEVYKADYDKATGRAELPEKLLDQAAQSADGPATEFVLMREARDLAAAQGDFETAVRAIDALAEKFKVDAQAMKASLLTMAAKSARSAEAATAAVDLAMELVGGAIARDDYKAAARFAATARELAKRTRDKSIVTAARERSAEVKGLSTEYGKVRRAKAKLDAGDDDPAANLLVGRYLCFMKGQWARGLPLLAKSSDRALQGLAKQELGRPTETADMVKLADAWWAAADKSAGQAKAAARGRAAHWYREAEPDLSGLKRDLAAKRIAEAGKQAGAGAGREVAGRVNLLRLADPEQDSVSGQWVAKGSTILSPSEGQAAFQFPYRPPDEYDYKLVFSLTGKGNNVLVLQMLAYRGTPFIFVMGREGVTFHYLRGSGIGANRSSVSKVWLREKGRRYTAIVKVRKNGAQAYIDGRLMTELKTDYTDVEAQPFWALRSRDLLGMGAGDCEIIVHSAEVAEITGTGERTREDPAGAEDPKAEEKNPARVVYMLDASGSMISQWAAPCREVAKSLDGIGDDQMFAVLIVTENDVKQVGEGMMKPTDENKQLVWDALRSQVTSGPDNAIAGIQAAAKLKPDLVWFVSDGDLKEPAKVVAAFKKAAGKRFKVNTVAAFASPDKPKGQVPLETLRKLAKATNGRCLDGDLPPAGNAQSPQERPRGSSIFDEK